MPLPRRFACMKQRYDDDTTSSQGRRDTTILGGPCLVACFHMQRGVEPKKKRRFQYNSRSFLCSHCRNLSVAPRRFPRSAACCVVAILMFLCSRLVSTAFLTTSLSLATKRAFSSTTSSCQALTMNYPIGLGTYQIAPQDIPEAIHSAIAVGYRRLDCAPVYFNEDAIGDALAKELQEKTVLRQDLYIVSKLASPFHQRQHVRLGLQKTLQDLRVDYLDLFLIHWPQAFEFVDIDLTKRGYDNEDIDDSDGGKRIDPTVSVHETWEAMEELVDQGLVKSIGVSNFPVSLLHELMTRCRIPPAVNQVEAHPYLQQTRLLQYCNARGVHFQAYSPLGTPGYKGADEPRLLDDPVLQQIAKAHNVSVANICLAWAVQRGTSVVAKSGNAQRQAENFHSLKVNLTELEIADIAKLDRGYRFFRPEDWWGQVAMNVFD